jgi:hypothetical protein
MRRTSFSENEILGKASLTAGLFHARSFAKVKINALVPLWLSTLAVAFCNRSAAQARPDTSLNTIITDSMSQRQLAGTVGSDTTVVIDSITAKLPFQAKPKKAALYSAMLPGAGQIYNRQGWKAPIVYAGMAASIYFLVDNTNRYRQYQRAYIADINNEEHEFSGLYSGADLRELRDGYRRYIEVTVLVTTLGYTIQVLDALVYAHLRGFDVSEDISLRLGPVQAPGGAGFGLTARLK